ncbi:MAG: NAD-dependent epimerase/dehydratase family protein, partial [Anaerolineae bacterium]
IYGASVSPPWSEMMTPAPQTSYGLSKWMGEMLCRGASVETIILRLARVYGLGSSMRWDELPHRFARLVAHGSSLPIYHGGKQRMDLIHIRDVSESIVRTLSLPLRGSQSLVLNIGSGNPVSVGGLARLCQQLAQDFKWAIPTCEQRKTDTFIAPSFGMDIRRAASWLGWKPEVDLLSGMAELMKASDVEK